VENTQRFSDRVDNYIKYRPSYPASSIDYLVKIAAIDENSVVADIGSGTGILTELLLPRVALVYAIEPNQEMRSAAELKLRNFPKFASIDGTAEHTTLADRSVDTIFAAQAFHWFDRLKAKQEFRRIIRPNGKVILVWNDRQNDTVFLQAYERGLRLFATDYHEVNHQNISDADLDLFFTGGFQKATFDNRQQFDLEGVMGRLNSSSYSPKPGTQQYIELQNLVRAAFWQYATNGQVSFEYDTNVFIGKV
jgi:SAM-dependent methyltransferase